MKTCNSCGKDKSDFEFHKRAASKDGLASKCKQCQKDYDKARANAPHRVAARKAYMQTDSGKAAHIRATKKWQKGNTNKRKAHIAVGNAIRDGKLIKPDSCEKCDCSLNLEAHHDDYSKPLDVRWLCQAHHKQWHAENGGGANPV